MQKKTNIIFSDFLDTIIGSNDFETSFEEECEVLQNFLINYLSENNYFVIVSSAHHFYLIDFVEYLEYITSNISEEQKSRLFFYVIDTNCNKVEYLNGFCLNLSNGSKAKAVEEALNTIFSNHNINKIIAAGDSKTDISMLLKVSSLGGESFLVADHRYYDALLKSTPQELIDRIFSATSYHNKYLSNIEINNFKNNLKTQLYSLYNEGKLSKEKLIELSIMYTEITPYLIKQWLNNCKDTELSTDLATETIKNLTLIKDRRNIFNIFNSKIQ